MSTQATTEAVVGIVKTLVAHPSLEELDWTEFAVVACTRPEKSFVHRMYGYVYTGDETQGAKLDVRALEPYYEQLIEATAGTDQGSWQKCLLQFDNTGRSNLQFEYTDDERWTIDPADLSALPAAIRPDFEAPAAADNTAN